MGSKGLIICRQASDPLTHGSRLRNERGEAYRCFVCGKAVAVTPDGLLQLAKHALAIVCNPCGFNLGRELAQRTKANIDVIFNPAAYEQIHKHGIPIDDILGKARANPPRTDTVTCPACDRSYIATEGAWIRCECGLSFSVAKHAG